MQPCGRTGGSPGPPVQRGWPSLARRRASRLTRSRALAPIPIASSMTYGRADVRHCPSGRPDSPHRHRLPALCRRLLLVVSVPLGERRYRAAVGGRTWPERRRSGAVDRRLFLFLRRNTVAVGPAAGSVRTATGADMSADDSGDRRGGVRHRRRAGAGDTWPGADRARRGRWSHGLVQGDHPVVRGRALALGQWLFPGDGRARRDFRDHPGRSAAPGHRLARESSPVWR